MAIDTSDVEYYGKDSEYVHFTVKKRGLKFHKIKVLRFASISIVARRFKLTLAVFPVKRGEKAETTVDKLLREIPSGLKVRAVLMDKGYYYTEVFKTFEKHNLAYIVPVKRYPQMDQLYQLGEATGVWRYKYTMNLGKETQYKINVYLEDMGFEDYIGFASNMDMKNRDFNTLSSAYQIRWNAENGYKESNTYRIKTNSRNHAYRTLIYMISHLLMSLQIIAKRINQTRITGDEMRQIFQLLLTPRHNTKRITKQLIITY